MKTTKRTIPTIKTIKRADHGRFRPAFTLGAAILALATTALAAPPEGKGGGNGGGGDAEPTDPELTINPVPNLLDPPIAYTRSELRWEGDLDGNGVADETEPSFRGVSLRGVNSQGFVVGTVASGPEEVDAGVDDGWRTGFINFDPNMNQLTEAVHDMNRVFAVGLADLNARLGLTEESEKWRVAWALSINEAHLITCLLLPGKIAYRFRGREEATPCLLAVANLACRTEVGSVMVVPTNDSPYQDFLDLNEFGDVLVHTHDPATDTYESRLFRIDDPDAPSGYLEQDELPLPGLFSWGENGPSFNNALEVLFRRFGDDSSTQQLIRYSAVDLTEDILLEGGADTFTFLPNGIAADGTAYVTVYEWVGKGKNKTRVATPYHVVSAAERTPLTDPAADGSAVIENFVWNLSSNTEPGEQEVVLKIEGTGEYQMYKPNFGARFTLADIAPGIASQYIKVSPPAVDNGTYAAGYIGYTTTAIPAKAWILTPAGAPVPGSS